MYNEDQLKITVKALDYLMANADLTTLQRQNAETAHGYINDFINGDMIMNIWTADDVKSLVGEDDGETPVTDQEAREVLKRADRFHDAAMGINWDVLRENLERVRES